MLPLLCLCGEDRRLGDTAQGYPDQRPMSEGDELLKHPVLLSEVLGQQFLGNPRMITLLLSTPPPPVSPKNWSRTLKETGNPIYKTKVENVDYMHSNLEQKR